jgi:hypothetical protein
VAAEIDASARPRQLEQQPRREQHEQHHPNPRGAQSIIYLVTIMSAAGEYVFQLPPLLKYWWWGWRMSTKECGDQKDGGINEEWDMDLLWCWRKRRMKMPLDEGISLTHWVIAHVWSGGHQLFLTGTQALH